MKITLYKFTKKVNSTALPTNGEDVVVQIKNDISIVNPVFEMSGATGSSPFTNYSEYNYCYVKDWNRYYFIRDIKLSRGRWFLTCHIDVLGTYRGAINNGTAYIKRANTNIATEPDSLHCTGKFRITYNLGVNPMPSSANTKFIVGIRGRNAAYDSLGNVCYYVMNHTALALVSTYLWTSEDIREVSEVDRGNYIVMCRAVAGDFPQTGAVRVKIADKDVHDGSNYLTCPMLVNGVNCYSDTTGYVDIPTHPQFTYKWLNAEPYASYIFNAGVFGTFTLPYSLLCGRLTLNYKVRVNPIDGVATLFIYDKNGNVAIRTSQQVFPTVDMASSNATIGNIIGNVLCEAIDTLQIETEKETEAYIKQEEEASKDFFNPKGMLDSLINSFYTSNFEGGSQVTNLGSFSKTENDYIKENAERLNAAEESRNETYSTWNTLLSLGKSFIQDGFNIGGFKIGGTPKISSSGGGGTITCLNDAFSLTGYFCEVRDVVPSTEGRAVNEVDVIGDYTGMVELAAVNIVPTGATKTERTELYNICNGVIYLE